MIYFLPTTSFPERKGSHHCPLRTVPREKRIHAAGKRQGAQQCSEMAISSRLRKEKTDSNP
jgi:hypothetical protein